MSRIVHRARGGALSERAHDDRNHFRRAAEFPLQAATDFNLALLNPCSSKLGHALVCRMAASLRAIEATVSADGVVTLAEPVIGPCKAVLTLLVEDRIPNAVTLAAMDEPLDDLPRYHTAADAKASLGI